jgi:ATP-dependent Clp protease ATP-binding subunit ClpA
MKLMNRARDVRTINLLLTGAEDEARREGAAMPGAEHLLLSAIALPDGTARRAFEAVGVDANGLRAAIEQQHADALRTVGVESPDPAELAVPQDDHAGRGGVFRSTASARSVFQAASKLAGAGPAKQLLGAHIVLAVTDMQHGNAVRALDVLGVDRAALAAAARKEADR